MHSSIDQLFWRFFRHASCLVLIVLIFAAACARGPVETGATEDLYGLQMSPVAFTPPSINNTQLANGITLDHVAEPEIPLVTVQVRIGVGSIFDPPDKIGAAALTAGVIRTGGSALLAGDDLDRELEARGAVLSVDTDREQTWFRLSVLKEDLAWGMELLANLLTDPVLPAEKLDEARSRQMVSLSQRLDQPRDFSRALFPMLVFGRENPWGRTTTPRTLEAIAVEDLRAIHKRFYFPGNIKLGMSGAVTWDEAQQLAAERIGSIPPREEILPELPEAPPVEQPVVYIVPRPVKQNVIYFGHAGVGRFVAEKFPIKVLNSILSEGQVSRLIGEVRVKRGLAYLVYGRLGEGTQRGVYFNVAMTKVASTLEALDAMLSVNEDLRATNVSDKELDFARQASINAFVFFFDTPEKLIHQKMVLDAFGYPADYLNTYVDKMSTVAADEVREAAERHLHLDKLVVLIVGEVDEALRARLESIGPITEIDDETLRNEWL